MLHEENKDDSQVYYPTINTVNLIFVWDHHSFIQHIFTEPYYGADLCQALEVQGEDMVSVFRQLTARGWGVGDQIGNSSIWVS